MIKLIIGIVIVLVLLAVVFWGAKKLLGFSWRKMHEIAGIEVGTSAYSLPYEERPMLSYDNSVSHNVAKLQQHFSQPNNQVLQTKHGKISAMPLFTGVNVDKINLMPTEAVVILDRIHDKLSRYYAWQHENAQSTQSESWLTEQKFVLDRLVSQTIPEAVNHYDQLARFNPHQLTQKIHHNMTASDILIEVLLGVDKQVDELLNELNQQVSQKLATTYHYMKARV